MSENPSTSKIVDVESLEERSFENEDFKAKISTVSIAMANSISNAVIDILNNSYVMVDEDLILNDDSDSENLHEKCTDDPTTDANYNPSDYAEPPRDYIPLEYKTKIVALAEAHPHWNLKTLQKQAKAYGRLEDKGVRSSETAEPLLNHGNTVSTRIEDEIRTISINPAGCIGAAFNSAECVERWFESGT
ncbi:hypothetical protein EAI_03986 [Harpegnathos saltator]|uniref:Uncharacterized protein n=1 Tax=Harpegnathos saltator TaxID=610380 RepID=E2B9F6_HARSA|nr:hypothetical protein EAI_03986 [Harpegnathos saltator]